MKSLTDYLSQYAEYHRDHRNILTHYAGIPLIVFSVLALLSKPSYPFVLTEALAVPLSPAVLAWLLSNLFYLKLDLRYGLVMFLLTGLLLAGAASIAQLPIMAWLSVSIGIFVFGWILQFIGHHFEGKKPAFVDDIMGLAIGPLFVVVEFSFLLGVRKEVQQQIEASAGVVH